MEITSRDNRLIREFRRLLADGKHRRACGRFALEGARLCEEAVLSGIPVEVVLYTVRAAEQYPAQTHKLLCATEAYEIPDTLATYLGDTEAPQGLFCICRFPEHTTDMGALSPSGRYAALEAVQDPGNLGTMIRTAEAFGLDGLLLSDGCCDPYNPKVLRSSMGGVLRLPLYSAGYLPTTLSTLRKRGMNPVACVVDGEAIPVQQVPFGPGSVAVIGNEGNGLTPETVAACAWRTTIPMSGRAESLNASMAAGIVFWEMSHED